MFIHFPKGQQPTSTSFQRSGRSDGSVTMRGVRHTGPILLNWRQPNNQAPQGVFFWGKSVEIWMLVMKIWKVDVYLESRQESESDESDVFVSAYGTVGLIVWMIDGIQGIFAHWQSFWQSFPTVDVRNSRNHLGCREPNGIIDELMFCRVSSINRIL